MVLIQNLHLYFIMLNVMPVMEQYAIINGLDSVFQSHFVVRNSLLFGSSSNHRKSLMQHTQQNITKEVMLDGYSYFQYGTLSRLDSEDDESYMNNTRLSAMKH